jgi:hypothetical protein
MKSQSHQLLLMLGLILSMTALALLFGMITPDPIRAESTLPPRGPEVTAVVPKNQKSIKSRPIGAYIELRAQSLPTSAWSVVQWQDRSGNWHDVDGWRGNLAQSTRWWVAAKDFGTGPFRWVVRQGIDGSLISTSAPFNLPDEANEILQIGILND